MSSLLCKRFVWAGNCESNGMPTTEPSSAKVGTYSKPIEFKKRMSNIQLLLHAQPDGAGKK